MLLADDWDTLTSSLDVERGLGSENTFTIFLVVRDFSHLTNASNFLSVLKPNIEHHRATNGEGYGPKVT